MGTRRISSVKTLTAAGAAARPHVPTLEGARGTRLNHRPGPMSQVSDSRARLAPEHDPVAVSRDGRGHAVRPFCERHGISWSVVYKIRARARGLGPVGATESHGPGRARARGGGARLAR